MMLKLLAAFAAVHVARASWIYGKKTSDHVSGTDDIAIDWNTVAINVVPPTSKNFDVSGADAPKTAASLTAELVKNGVRAEEAKNVGEWASASDAFESRTFEFKYINDVGSVTVKLIFCKREKKGDGSLTISTRLREGNATGTVKALKNVHHEKTVTKRIAGIRIKRHTERWTTQEDRGLTRQELEHLSGLLADKVNEAMRSLQTQQQQQEKKKENLVVV
uniref:GOLD domain-containing protein n=1 Tax=Chromera velia CCMP2878 TaxID=1169474 RepID=A0A0G4H0E9_9ALVE|eukprot:Cvel_24202.t1-p1 / transcript=Cvel_24202.t1 / gene=Cvel_24202 / organism=Chromera_velia_CCMP2878 / gene_product=hypothetical protein / transcript_product=hypothetical protein / location=Cvel_scaffold2585:21358-22099(-) / protein_length=219 / sequence_SO=supercontig / SO=protein_coding / is_pseudo=false